MDEGASYSYFEDVNWGLLRLWGSRRGLRVLDVGCGFATTSSRIQELGNEVTGIENSAAASDVAAGRIARVVVADLQDICGVEAALAGQQFDVLIFADVLEHLAWPAGVLRQYLGLLAPQGSVFVSLPNVALWSVRLAHLAGRWEYADTGVLDRTHLRFFTRRSSRWLLRETRLEPVRTTYNPGLVRPFVPLAKSLLTRGQRDAVPDPAALLESPAYRLYLRTVLPAERLLTSLWPGMLAFQMVYEAKRVP